MTISNSDGVVILSVLSPFASIRLLLFSPDVALGLRCGLGRLTGLHLFQVLIEAVEVLVPEPAKISAPAVDLFELARLDATWPPLRFPPARDQSRTLEHLEVL